MFGDRQDRNVHQNRLVEFVRDVESGLSNRMQRLETQVQKHSGLIEDLHLRADAAENSFRSLLTTFEGFCNHPTRNIERMSHRMLPALQVQTPPVKFRRLVVAGAGAVIAVAVIIGLSLWPAHDVAVNAKQDRPASSSPNARSAEPVVVSAASAPAMPLERASANSLDRP